MRCAAEAEAAGSGSGRAELRDQGYAPTVDTGKMHPWEVGVVVAYAAISAAVAFRFLLVFFPNGLGAPGAMPPLCAVGEACVLLSCALLGAFNFGRRSKIQHIGALHVIRHIANSRHLPSL